MEKCDKSPETANWKAMYMTLLQGVNYAVEICEDKTVSGVLVKAMLDAEECYISSTAGEEPSADVLPAV